VLASPIPDPTGVACAGDELWLLNGGHNSQTHRLVRYNIVDGGISFDHSYTGLIEQAGTGVYGITTHDSSVWLSVSGNRNKLVQVDATTGALGRVIGSPTFLGPSDLETDGQTLIVSTGLGEVYRVTLDAVPRTTRLFKTWNIHDRDIGIASLGADWLVAGLFGVLHTYSASGDFVGEVRLPERSFRRGGRGRRVVHSAESTDHAGERGHRGLRAVQPAAVKRTGLSSRVDQPTRPTPRACGTACCARCRAGARPASTHVAHVCGVPHVSVLRRPSP
jgi:hypothetical protein